MRSAGPAETDASASGVGVVTLRDTRRLLDKIIAKRKSNGESLAPGTVTSILDSVGFSQFGISYGAMELNRCATSLAR